MHDAQSLWRRTPAIRLRPFRAAATRPGPLAAWTSMFRRAGRWNRPTATQSRPTQRRSGTELAASPPRTAVDTTFDLAPVGIMHLDKRGEPMRVNPELCEL